MYDNNAREYRRLLHGVYSIFTEGKCANPSCESESTIEVHHILPMSKGGCDKYWNLISLCRSCHDMKGLHNKHKDWDIELFTWKCYQELSLWGFVLDEQHDDFYENLKTLLLKYR